MDIQNVLRELSAADLREWEAYYQLEPFGEAWKQTALIACILANANRDPEKREPFEVDEFMPLPPDIKLQIDDDDPETADEEIVMDEPDWVSWKKRFAVMVQGDRR